MLPIFEEIASYFELPGVQRAFIVAPLIALCSSLLGVTLVLKRYSFIGEGLSHMAFGAMAFAAVVGITNNMLIALPATVLAAVILLKTGTNARVKGDAAVAMLAVSALALGYLLLALFPTVNFTADVCKILFGDAAILTLTVFDVIGCAVLSVVTVGLFIFFYNKIFAVTFDENFARATGVKAGAYNLVIAIITAVIIVLAMKLVGSLLVSALIIFPALSAMRLFKTFKSVTICAAIISVGVTVFSILLTFIVPKNIPIGPTIVAADIIVFFVFWLISIISGKARRRA